MRSPGLKLATPLRLHCSPPTAQPLRAAMTPSAAAEQPSIDHRRRRRGRIEPFMTLPCVAAIPWPITIPAGGSTPYFGKLGALAGHLLHDPGPHVEVGV